jgi:hypothetical protein
MPHFKIYFAAAFGDNEAIVEAESEEAAREKFEADREDAPRIVSVDPYTQTLGQTLVMGSSRSGYSGTFGYGDDLAAAKKAFTKAGGSLTKPYDVIVFDAETDFIGVTPMGGYRWLGNAPTTTRVEKGGK